MQSFAEHDAAEPPAQSPLRSLNEALTAERLRLDHRMEQIGDEMSALADEGARTEQRLGCRRLLCSIIQL